jgi:hypothetical protein
LEDEVYRRLRRNVLTSSRIASMMGKFAAWRADSQSASPPNTVTTPHTTAGKIVTGQRHLKHATQVHRSQKVD